VPRSVAVGPLRATFDPSSARSEHPCQPLPLAAPSEPSGPRESNNRPFSPDCSTCADPPLPWPKNRSARSNIARLRATLPPQFSAPPPRMR